MAYVVTPAYAVSAYGEDYLVVANIGADERARIAELSHACEQLDSLRIEEFFYDFTVMAWGIYPDNDEETDLLNEGRALYYAELPAWLGNEAERIEIPMLRVTKGSFGFSFMLKHGSHLWETNDQDLEELFEPMEEVERARML